MLIIRIGDSDGCGINILMGVEVILNFKLTLARLTNDTCNIFPVSFSRLLIMVNVFLYSEFVRLKHYLCKFIMQLLSCDVV